MRRILALLAALAFALPASAADEPEAVFAKYHRAAVAGNLDEMLRYTTDSHRAEMSAMSPEQRAASFKLINTLMPAKYAVRAKSVYPESGIARLYIAGEARATIDSKPGMLYGVVRLVVQRGEWKVGNVEWSNQDPGFPPNLALLTCDPTLCTPRTTRA